MAGRGPAPKDPNKRARTNSSPDLRVIYANPSKQPALPNFTVERYDADRDEWRTVRFVWPAQTKAWWQMWAASPLAKEFTANDWSELMDTALLHAQLWKGDIKVAGELRLRVSKFGATPEDRARLRITFAQADQAEKKPTAPNGGAARSRRGALKAV